MIHVKDGVAIIQESLDKGKENEVDAGVERLETASKLIDKANKELKNLSNLTIGNNAEIMILRGLFFSLCIIYIFIE